MKYVPGAAANNTKKALGQHWLHDSVTLDAIVEAASVEIGDNVLEIGPGLGTLTERLASAKANVTALEFDQDLILGLNKKFKNIDNVEICEGDIRTFNYTEFSKNYKIVANIPYYLTSHLIRAISETENPPEISVLLIQKEVAQRLCARPGQMSILGVTAQFYFDCSLDIFVPAALFTPPPKVDSQVVVLKKRSAKLFDVNEKELFRLVKAGFSEKRKTLRNSLSGGLQLEKPEVETVLSTTGVRPTQRAQELSLDQWYLIYKAYENFKETYQKES